VLPTHQKVARLFKAGIPAEEVSLILGIPLQEVQSSLYVAAELGNSGNELAGTHGLSTAFGWKDRPFPRSDDVELLTLPDGRILEDACIWRNFVQTELGIDPAQIWRELLRLPDWPDKEPIPFRENGSDPHWIRGSHPALNYRGNDIRRHKIWCQADFSEGLRRYNYSGWQWRIGYATHDIGHVEPIQTLAQALNAGLAPQHNHWIVTRYEDGSDNIGYHSDKTADFHPNSWFVVIKLGEPRPFAFRVKAAKGEPEQDPFFSKVLPAGTAIFCRAKSSDGFDANNIVEHGVPPVDTICGTSGSIVSRCITTVIPWNEVIKEVADRTRMSSGGRTSSRKKETGRQEVASKENRQQGTKRTAKTRGRPVGEKVQRDWTPPKAIGGLGLPDLQQIITSLEFAQTDEVRQVTRCALANQFGVRPNTIDWVQATRTRAKKTGSNWPFPKE
jgi:hypothetical protein